MLTAIREMPVWKDCPYAAQIPKGLTVRRGEDASGRSLIVVSNQNHKAFSFPILMIQGESLPEFFVERLKTL